jgi:hypothetical protein
MSTARAQAHPPHICSVWCPNQHRHRDWHDASGNVAVAGECCGKP